MVSINFPQGFHRFTIDRSIPGTDTCHGARASRSVKTSWIEERPSSLLHLGSIGAVDRSGYELQQNGEDQEVVTAVELRMLGGVRTPEGWTDALVEHRLKEATGDFRAMFGDFPSAGIGSSRDGLVLASPPAPALFQFWNPQNPTKTSQKPPQNMATNSVKHLQNIPKTSSDTIPKTSPDHPQTDSISIRNRPKSDPKPTKPACFSHFM